MNDADTVYNALSNLKSGNHWIFKGKNIDKGSKQKEFQQNSKKVTVHTVYISM